MPAAGAAIGAAAGVLATPLGAALLIGGAAVLLGVLWGLNTPDAKTDESTQKSDNRPTLKVGENVPIDAIFGQQITAGQYAGHQSYGDDYEYLKLVFILGSRRHESLEGIIVNDSLKTLTGSNSNPNGRSISEYNVVPDSGGSSANHMWVKFYSGTLGQTADAELVSHSDPPTRWTEDHRFAGHAYAIVTIRYNKNEDDLRSIPSFHFIMKGLRLYDPRKDDTQPGGSGAHRWADQSTYEWTENPAIQLYNYKRGIYLNDVLILGEGCSDLDIDLDYVVAAANLSDEEVEYTDTEATLPRYTCGVLVDAGMSPQQVCSIFEQAMGGVGMISGGKYAPIPAAARSSVMTILDDDIQKGHPRKARKKMAPVETYTAVHGTYSKPSKGWQAISYGIRKDSAVDTAQGGRRTLALDLNFVHDLETAQALAEIQRRRDLYTATEELVVRHKFVRLQPGDVVERQSEVFGTIDMMVQSVEELEDGSVALSLREWNNVIVPTAEGFMTIPDEDGITVAVPARITTVLGLTAEAISLEATGTDIRAGILVNWDTILDPTVRSVLIRYWPSTTTEAEAQTLVVGNVLSDSQQVLMGLLPETEYFIKATIVTEPARSVVWTSTISCTTLAESYTFEIDAGNLPEELRDWQEWIGQGLRDVIDEMEKLAQSAREQDLGNYRDMRLIERNLLSTYENARAEFNEEIVAATGPNSAIVSQLTQLEAQVGDNLAEAISGLEAQIGVLTGDVDDFNDQISDINTAIDGVQDQITGPGGVDSQLVVMAQAFTSLSAASVNGDTSTANFRMQVVSGPSGYSRMGMQTRVAGAGSWRGAALFLDTPNSGSGKSRVVIDAEQFVLLNTANSGTFVPFLFDNTTGEAQMMAARINIIKAGILQNASGSSFFNLNTGTLRIST